MSKKAEMPSDPGMILTIEERRYIRCLVLAYQSCGHDERSSTFHALEFFRILKERFHEMSALDALPMWDPEVGASGQKHEYTIVSELLSDGTIKAWRRRGDELLPEHLR